MEAAGAPSAQASSIRVSQRPASSVVTGSGSGWGPAANWLTSLPTVMPRKCGRPARAAARVRR